MSGTRELCCAIPIDDNPHGLAGFFAERDIDYTSVLSRRRLARKAKQLSAAHCHTAAVHRPSHRPELGDTKHCTHVPKAHDISRTWAASTPQGTPKHVTQLWLHPFHWSN